MLRQEVAIRQATFAPVVDAVLRDGFFQQRLAVPGRPKQHRRRTRGSGHRPELAVEPIRVDVLRLIRYQTNRSGVPGHVRFRRCAEEYRPSLPYGNRWHGRIRPTIVRQQQVAPAEDMSRPFEADSRLRVERRRTQHQRAAILRVFSEQRRNKHRGDFVLPRLARKHHGERFARTAAHLRHQRPHRPLLVVP